MVVLPRMFLIGLLVAPMTSSGDTQTCTKDGNTLIMGVREDAPPFAWRIKHDVQDQANNGRPRYMGYSVALCELIARRALQERQFEKTCMEPVTAKSRFRKLANSEIHLLCGASTVTIARMEKVDFSLFTFLSGASILYNAQTDRDDPEDRAQLKIGFLKGTTTEDEVLRIGGDFYQRSNGGLSGAVDIERIQLDTHDAAIDEIIGRKIDAYLADREILLALRQRIRNKLRDQADQEKIIQEPEKAEKADKSGQAEGGAPVRPRDIMVSEHYFTFEPYAIGIAKNERKLRITANKVLSELFNWQSSGFMGQNIATVLARYFPGKNFSEALQTLFMVQRIPVGTPIDLNGQN